MTWAGAILAFAAGLHGIPAGGVTQPVSEAALATTISEDGVTLDLLIVWKGAPGWFHQMPRAESAGGSGRTYHESLTYGNLQLDVQFNFATRVAQIMGHRVALGTDNVVLVDGVDVQGRSRIAGTLTIEATLSDSHPDVTPLIARSSQIANYVDCGAKPPTPGPIADMSDWCAPLLAEGAQITAPPESHVRAALQRYVRLVGQMDHAGIAAMFAPDGEIVNPGRDAVKGPAAIEAFLKQFSEYHVVNEMMVPKTTRVDGDRATQEGTFRQRVRGPDGNMIDVSGAFALDWIRDAAGVWRIQRAATRPDR